MQRRPRYFLHSYGCQMNKLDSELVEARLRAAGYEAAAAEAEADVVLLNTCSVRQHAEDRVWSRLGALRARKRREPQLVVGVLGCMAENHQRFLQARMPHVDLVVGPSAFGDIDAKVEAARARNRDRGSAGAGIVAVGAGVSGDAVVRDVKLRPHRSQAYISVTRGCNMVCTYCIVPLTRGPELSRPIPVIVEEALALVDDGVTEVTLLGQTVNAYGRDLGGGTSLSKLLRALHEIPALRRIAFITSHPNFLSKELIDTLAELPRISRFLHLPVQSGSDRVLRAMQRGYTVTRYLDRIDRLRERVPDIELHSDFIVGYPGEDESDFLRTVELMERVRFAQSYVFKYSPRPGTAAFELADTVGEEEKARRNQVLLEIQERHCAARNRELLGTVQEVLVEGPSPRNAARMSGRTSSHRIVHFPADEPDLIGRYVPVRIRAALAHSLVGERLGEDEAECPAVVGAARE
jgi:tRNA-2-methylthio-N6-dimethylallyladenosine synthase